MQLMSLVGKLAEENRNSWQQMEKRMQNLEDLVGGMITDEERRKTNKRNQN
jgi:hypothetical protein